MRSIKGIGAGLLAVVLAGCNTMGKNLPLEEAKFRVIEPLVAERVQPVPPAPLSSPEMVVRMADALWQPGFQEFRLMPQAVQQVGRAGGQTFYALSWDRVPFDRLLIEVPGRPGTFLEYLGVR